MGRHRPLTVVLCAALGVALAIVAHGATALDAPLFELSLAARSLFWSASEPPESADVAVIAIDQRSLDEPELAASPRVLMAKEWARTLDAVLGAGARAVGFDVIFKYSGNQFAADFDQPFLAALNRHRDRVVLARSVTSVPAAPFIGALRADPEALGFAELVADRDGSYRRVRREYETDGGVLPGLAAAVLRRGRGPSMADTVLLAPRRHLETLPTYALIDVLRCADVPEVLARAFRDKFVFVGTTLPEEDRRYTAGRFLAPPRADGPKLHACGLHRLAASAPETATVPGVFVHAAAVEAVARHHVVTTTSASIIAVVAGVTGGVGAGLGFALTPWLTLIAVAIVAGLVFAGATVALAASVWIPIAVPILALGLAPVGAYVVRYVVEDRVRRRIEHAFSHYLAPAVVDRLARDATALRLGGELRQVTVMFADLSGFTALSGRVSAEVLTRVTNEYLAYIVDAVEATGGYVDKFIGDAVMAMWGAPAVDPGHASHAVGAALAAAARIKTERALAERRGAIGYGVKIGVNSGPAVVGNVGTAKRYNYTAVGETVNVAARLESVPGLYGCDVVVGGDTVSLASQDFLWTEVDTVRVKGREAPLTLWIPVASRDAATPAQRDLAARFATALADYRAMRFADAAATWDAVARDAHEADALANAATAMAARARTFALKPPPEPWDGVWVLTSK